MYITYAKKKRHSCFMRNAQIKFSCLYDIKCIKEQHLMRHLGTISSDENETNEKNKTSTVLIRRDWIHFHLYTIRIDYMKCYCTINCYCIYVLFLFVLFYAIPITY